MTAVAKRQIELNSLDPVLATKHPSEPSRQRGAHVVQRVDVVHRIAFRCRQTLRVASSQGRRYFLSRNRSDLVSIDESETLNGRYGDAVEKVKVWLLKDVLDRSNSCAVRGAYDRSDGQTLVGNWLFVAHGHPLTDH
jgi:hypothetical protein